MRKNKYERFDALTKNVSVGRCVKAVFTTPRKGNALRGDQTKK